MDTMLEVLKLVSLNIWPHGPREAPTWANVVMPPPIPPSGVQRMKWGSVARMDPVALKYNGFYIG